MSDEVEVRRCHGCKEVAVLSAANWQHTRLGFQTGIVTRDYRCQSCGRSFTIRPGPQIMGTALAGLLLICTPMGLPILGLAWWMAQQEKQNPKVPGALPPARKYRAGPQLRKCGSCGSVAAPYSMTQNRVNGIPVGIEVGYRCQGCNRAFTIESIGGQLMNAASAVVVGAIGVALLRFAEHPGWRFGGGGLAVLLAVVMLGLIMSRVFARSANPVQDDGLL